MKSLIKKILKESVKDDFITIAGINFTTDGYISPQPNGKSDLFLTVSKSNNTDKNFRGEPYISFEKFNEVKSVFKNVGIKCSPQTYNSDGNRVVNVYQIRVENLDLRKAMKIYLDTLINTNSDDFFEPL